jgi:septum site-determining protein MinC
MPDTRQPSSSQTERRRAKQSAALEIKGSVFTLGVVHLLVADLKAVASELDAKLRLAPRFFRHAPLVIDLQALPVSGEALDFPALVRLLRQHELIPVGVRNASAEQQEAALRAGLGLIQGGRPERENRASDPAPAPAQTPTRVITQPVRSGQQIYAQGGDLIVLAPVSAGAELLADGHIHVYAPLRGRALAGIKGNTGARIFCQFLEAELISVAGHYRVIEDLDDSVRGKPAQAYLEGERLTIRPL